MGCSCGWSARSIAAALPWILNGLDPAALLAHKLAGGSAASFPSGGQDRATAIDVLAQVRAHVLLEASPVNLRDAQPALGTVLAALDRGLNVVLANKAPLALYFQEVQRAAAVNGARLAFSATVCGGLPVVNVGQRDLVAAEISRVEGIFNSTSNYILTQMTAGRSYADALAEAQRRGIAETDPTLDVDGWDTANKLTIVANAVLGFPATVRDVQPVTGIQSIEPGPCGRLAERHVRAHCPGWRTGGTGGQAARCGGTPPGWRI